MTRSHHRTRSLGTRLSVLVPALSLALLSAVPASAAANGSISEYGVPTTGSLPTSIVAGPDGNLWFAELAGSKVGVINPGTHAVTDFLTPTTGSSPSQIAAGSDGNLWFTENSANQIGMVDPATDAISEFPIPTASSSPIGITTGPDGNLWFTEFAADQIGVINPTTDAITEFAIPTPSSGPQGIASGPDGNIWFTEDSANKVGAINPSTHVITEFSVDTGVAPQHQPDSGIVDITTGPDGNLWFTESAASQVGTINSTTHAITQIPTPTTGSRPEAITKGPDGNLWFTEYGANNIGMVDPATHFIRENPVPATNSGPDGIIAGSDGNLWFTEEHGNQIGELVLAPKADVYPENLAFGLTPDDTVSPPSEFTVSNSGGRTLSISNVSLAGADPGQFSVASDSCAGAQVAPRDSCEIWITFAPTTLGTLSASLVITDDADNVPGNTQSVLLSGTSVLNSDLVLSLGAAPNPAQSRKPLTYTITVSDAGPTDATGVVVSDTLPSQSQFVGVQSSRGTCTAPAKGATGTLTCSLGSLANGSTSTTTINVTIVAPHKSSVSDTASVTGGSYDPNLTNNKATVTILFK